METGSQDVGDTADIEGGAVITGLDTPLDEDDPKLTFLVDDVRIHPEIAIFEQTEGKSQTREKSHAKREHGKKPGFAHRSTTLMGSVFVVAPCNGCAVVP
jgi:hypothetical protein